MTPEERAALRRRAELAPKSVFASERLTREAPATILALLDERDVLASRLAQLEAAAVRVVDAADMIAYISTKDAPTDEMYAELDEAMAKLGAVLNAAALAADGEHEA